MLHISKNIDWNIEIKKPCNICKAFFVYNVLTNSNAK